MTKRDKFVEIVDVLTETGADETLVEAIKHEIELLDKRKGAERKPTKAQLANEALKADMVDILADGPMTATDVAKATDESVQKISQLFRQLVADGRVTRTEGKGKTKTTFSVA